MREAYAEPPLKKKNSHIYSQHTQHGKSFIKRNAQPSAREGARIRSHKDFNSEMGRGFKPKGGRGRGRGRGYAAQQEQEEEWRAQQARKRRGEESSSEEEEEETSDEDDEDEDDSSSSGEEEEKIVKVKEFDRFAGIGVQEEEEEEESSDDDDSSSSSSFEDEYLKPKAKPKPKAVDDAPPQKSAKQLAEEMEKLRIVRERRAAQAKARIEAEGYDRYAPPEAGGRPRIE